MCIARKQSEVTKANINLLSATMDLAYTAMGSFDIWWEGGCWEWYAFCRYKSKDWS